MEHEVALEKYQKEAMRLRTEKEAFEIKEAEKQRQQQDVDKLEEGMNQTEQAIKDLTSVSIQSEGERCIAYMESTVVIAIVIFIS